MLGIAALIGCGSGGEPPVVAVPVVAAIADPPIIGEVPRPPAGCGAIYDLRVDPPCATARISKRHGDDPQCRYDPESRDLFILPVKLNTPIGARQRLDCWFECGTFSVRIVDHVDPNGPVAAGWTPGAWNCDQTVVYQGNRIVPLTTRGDREPDPAHPGEMKVKDLWADQSNRPRPGDIWATPGTAP